MKITEYREQVRAPSADTRVQRMERPDPSGFNALAVLDQGVGRFASAYQQREDEDARAWSANKLSEARLAMTERMIQSQSEFKPGPGQEFTSKFLAEYDDYTGKMMADAPNQRAQKYMEQRLSDFRADIGTRAMVFEAGARIDWRADQFKLGAQNIAKSMLSDPTQYATALAEWLATIDGADMPQVKKSEIREWGMNLISKSAAMTGIQRSPTQFLESIGFGVPQDPDLKTTGTTRTRASSGVLTDRTGNMAFDALPFDARMQLFDQAIRAKAQVDADADRATVQMRKRVSDDMMKEAWDRHYSGKLDLDFIQQIKPVISDNEYKALRVALRAGPEARMADDRDTVSTLTQMMYKAGGAQEAMNFAHTAFANGLLTVDTYRTETARARGLLDNGGPKDTYERTRGFIAQALNPGQGDYDPARHTRLADALRTFDDWRAANRKAGDADVQKRGDEILDQFMFISLRDSVIGLPMPRGTTIKRSANPESLQADIGAAGTKLQKMRDSKELTPMEYQQEMATLNRWRRALERSLNK